LRAIAAAALVVACSGAHPTNDPRPQPGSAGVAPIAADAPNERECDQLIAHAVELRIAELRATKPSQLPTDADQQAAATSVRTALGAECRHVSRTAYACAIAAKTTHELTGCDH
jgi:hypothetical protein